MPAEKRCQRASQSHGHHHVKAGAARKCDHPDARQKDKGAQFRELTGMSLSLCGALPYGRANAPRRSPVNEKRAEQSTERRTETRRVFADADYAVTCDHQPVEQRRLLKPRQPAQRRGNQIVASQHLARDLGVARLVRADQRQPTQSPNIKAADPDKEKKPDALGKD